MRKTILSILILMVSVLLKNTANAQTQYAFINTSDGYTGTWTCPEGVTSVTVSCWAAGGAGGSAFGSDVAGGGAAGGSFSKKTITVVPGAVYNYAIGAGGLHTDPLSAAAGGNGGDTWFVNAQSVFAQGGSGGNNAAGFSESSPAGSGGIATATNNLGDATFAGGSGANGDPSIAIGGGGGGAAGDESNGGDALTYIAGNGGANGGSDGGNGQETYGAQPGSSPGGGGGGAYSASFFSGTVSGGDGGDGQIILTWELGSVAIHIESFTGNKTDKGNALNLILNTTNERNIEVHLEKNAGDKKWTDIAQQKIGNEPGRHSFDFEDDKITAAINQYRAKVITDGLVRYSNIVAIGNNEKTVASIKMIPNPSTNTSVLNIQSLTDENATITVTDISGKTIWSHSTNLHAGNNDIEMNLSNLNAGNYQVTVLNQNGDIATSRFVKQ